MLDRLIRARRSGFAASAGGSMRAPSFLPCAASPSASARCRPATRVDLTLHAGDMLGLLGENGAGKTSLMNVLFGTYAADAGTSRSTASPADIRSSADALELGIGMVHQHFQLVPRHTVLENLMVGAPGRRLRLDRAGARSPARRDRPRFPPRAGARRAGRRSHHRRAAARGDRQGRWSAAPASWSSTSRRRR